MHGRWHAALGLIIAVSMLEACASPSRGLSSAEMETCLERATKLSRSASPMPTPEAASYWLSSQRLGTPSAEGLYGLEAAYREMVYRECRDEGAAALPRQR